MAKVVIDARESGTSTGRYVDKLIEYLAKPKLDHQFVVLAKPEQVEAVQKLAPKFKVVSTPIKEFTFAEQFKLRRVISHQKADLVHFPIVQQPILYRGPVVTTMQDLTTIRFNNPDKNWLVFKFKQLVYIIVNFWVVRKSAALIAPSNFIRDDVSAFTRISPAKFTVTYESADKITTKPEPVEGLGDRFIMYLGRPLPHKNLERLVEAFAKLREQKPELKLVLAGKTDGNFLRLEKFASQHTDGVVFTGFVSEGQLRWLYEHTAAYVFPSLSEGFGLPGLEAMQHGAPVVSSNATCLPEIYHDAALYFDPRNIDDIAAKINQVLDDKKLADELVKKGHELVKSYSWQRMAEQTLDVYEKILNKS